MAKRIDAATRQLAQKAWEVLIEESQMLGQIIASLQWKVATDARSETISVNKRTLLINDVWWAEQSYKGRVFLLAHEATHIVQRAWDKKRVTDKHWLEPKRCNKALDYAANGLLLLDSTISQYIPPGLMAEGCFPSHIGQPNGLSFEHYFDIIGPQAEDKEDPDGEDGEPNSDDEYEEGESPEADDDPADDDPADADEDEQENERTEDILNRIRERGDDDQLNKAVRESIVPREDVHTIENFKEILRDFLWKKTRDEKTYRRPSRRWDGEGPVLPGRSSRDFPKTCLILDFSYSMKDAIKACASSVVQLIKTTSNDEVYVIGCSHKVDHEWIIRRNERPPTEQEILNAFTAQSTDMMPGIIAARKWGAEVIFCVSDMEVPLNNMQCNDVNWITSHKNHYIKHWRNRYDLPKQRVFDVLNLD